MSGQAKEAILQYIEEMDLKTDNKLPREEALAEMLGVSRNKMFYYVEQDCWISLSICANGLRIINKKGLDAALTEAVAKGYCDWKSIKVIG